MTLTRREWLRAGAGNETIKTEPLKTGETEQGATFGRYVHRLGMLHLKRSID